MSKEINRTIYRRASDNKRVDKRNDADRSFLFEPASLSQARSRELSSPCPKTDIPDFR